MKYPYRSSKSALRSAVLKGNRLIKKEIGLKNFMILQDLNASSVAGNNSLKRRLIRGRLNQKTRRLHNEIIRRQFKGNRAKDKKDPDFYMFGGLPASQKTTVLTRKVPEKTIVIDNDYYKSKLAKRSKSPFRRYPLAHASYLHEEGDVLVKRAIRKALRERRDVTIDATFRTYGKGKELIKKFRNAGYDIHYLGTQKSPSKTILHVAQRFLKKGRYVPLEYIRDNGNEISKNSWKARKLGDSYVVYDTNTLKSKIIAKSRENMRKNFRNP